MLSEISTPDIDFSERKKILDALEKHEKLKEELDLENCLQSLTGKPLDLSSKHDIESMASKSVSDMKQLADKPVNIYKPNLTQKMPTPRVGKPQQQNLFAQYVQQEQRRQPKVQTLFDSEDPQNFGT